MSDRCPTCHQLLSEIEIDAVHFCPPWDAIVYRCQACGKVSALSGPKWQRTCSGCGKDLPPETILHLQMQRDLQTPLFTYRAPDEPGIVTVLKLIAVLTLIGGMCVAIGLWATGPASGLDRGWRISLGFAVFGGSILDCVLMLVVCKITNLLVQIRNSLREIQAQTKDRQS
jgi:hypothetical protein